METGSTSGGKLAGAEAVLPQAKRKGFAALLLAILIWGSTFVATKDALQAFPPTTLAALRFLFAVAFLLPFHLRRRLRSPSPPLRISVLMGFTGGFLYFALQNLALVYCRAGTACLILASIPVFTALASRLFLNELISPARVGGIFLSISGVAVLVWSESSRLLEGALNLGGPLLIGAAMAWAAYTVIGRKLSHTFDPILATFQTTLWGVLFLLPLALLETQPVYGNLGAESWLVLLYLGVIASALPIFLWNYALKTYEASPAGVYLNLVPLVAIALATLFLRERLTFLEVVAGLMVLTGVVLAERHSYRRQGTRTHLR
ncbi:MAG: DMT family transporter [Bacillota bacterium]